MSTLIEFIRFEGKRFADVTDEEGMKIMLEWDEKLQPLEKEILQYPKATIMIKKSGNIFFDSFPRELIEKINKL